MALFLLGTGFFLLVSAGYVFYQSHYLRRNIETQGAVIDLKVDEEGAAQPVVRFITQNGQEVTFTGQVAFYPPAHTVGQIVTVVYPPNRPDQARIKGESDRFLFVFVIIGGILFLLGVGDLIMGWFGGGG
ncbi:DUF3592 domain-containing protein [Chloroflexus sp.]|uniref:DUF3592 domain-containing protein n=1 Tax=Chloroflexus sp. TaxID=1904827 RepID=UPI002ACEEBC0|nr:DUF3592 domain-containing protein [Chloroflexus sp.]